MLEGLDANKIDLLQNNHKLYPCGVDFIFCSATSITAITRSTKIKSAQIDNTLIKKTNTIDITEAK
jgi:hypothetical protein